MAQRQFTDVQDRPTEFLELTSLTRDELQQLVPPFEAAFQVHMAVWRLDEKPQTARRFRVDQHWPLPTPEHRRLFMLAYAKTYSLTAKAALDALRTQGYSEAQLPAPSTMAEVLNRLGFRLRKVVKAKPQKKIAETDAIFANIEKKTTKR